MEDLQGIVLEFLIEYWIHRSGLSGMEYWTLDSGHRTMDTGQ